VAAGRPPPTTLTDSLNLHDYDICHRSTLGGPDPGPPWTPRPPPPLCRRNNTAERAVTRESVSSLKLLRLDSAVSSNDLVQDFISDQLSFNGTVLLVLGQPALAREHVRLRALRCSTNIPINQSINQSISQ